MSKVYFGLGSNIDERLINLQNGVNNLASAGIHLLRVSSVYETKPRDYYDQDDFYNIAVEAETDMNPFDLLAVLKKIENDMGRKKTVRFGPRNIDIDILLYDNNIINSENLIIPHERMHERLFVLAPLSELIPNYVHPILNETVLQLSKKLDQSVIKLDKEIII